jgi:hypothetical protein
LKRSAQMYLLLSILSNFVDMEPIHKRMTLKPFTRLFSLILFLLMMAGAIMPTAAQETNGLAMRVLAGYDGYYKTRTWIPVLVNVSNEGPPIEGELRITHGSDAAGDQVVYNTPISLPTQSNKQLFMYVYPQGFSTSIEVELLADNGRSLLKAPSNNLRQLSSDGLLYGVVTPEPGNLDYLEDVWGGRSEAAVAYLEMDQLPDLPSAWNGLDVLVFHDVDTGQLTPEQQESLTAWLNTGGQLVIAGGAGWQKTSTAFADMLPVAVTSSETVADLPALQTAVGEPFRDPGPYLVTMSSLSNGEMIFHESGLPLLAKRPFGQGAVFFLALDPSLAPLIDWAGSEIIWAAVADNVPNRASWADGFQNGWAAVSAVSSLPSLAMPPVFQLAGYLLLYILVIGPLNYVVLKRLNRRELAWVTIPALVLLFSGIAYLTGFQLKGNVTILNQMSVASGEVGSENMRASTLLGLYSPRRSSYNVMLPIESMAHPISDNYTPGSSSSVAAITRSNDVILSEVRVDVSDVETFVADSVPPGMPISGRANLRVDNGDIKLSATIRNESETNLEDAVLLIGTTAVAIGDIPAGKEIITTEVVGAVTASGSPSFYAPGYGSPLMANADTILGTVDYYNDREVFPRWQLLQALEDEYLAGAGRTPSSQVTFLAWTDEQLLETVVQDEDFSSHATTLYLLEMPVQDDMDSGELTVPLNLLNWVVLGSNNMYGESIRSFYMPELSWMEVEFTPWAELDGMKVDDVAIHLSTQSGQTSSLVPTVRMWEWDTDEWVDLDEAAWGETAVSDPQRFLNDDNTMRLRLQNKSQVGLDIEAFYPLLTGELE